MVAVAGAMGVDGPHAGAERGNDDLFQGGPLGLVVLVFRTGHSDKAA